MTSIDWSKAPDGTTHFDPAHGGCWVKYCTAGSVGAFYLYEYIDGVGWGWQGYDLSPAMLDRLVERPTEKDPVNHPEHYTAGGIECIDAIEAALTPEEFRGYCKGNALKYIWRERHKGGEESLRKARWYINKLTNED